jgi:antitoxin MazE
MKTTLIPIGNSRGVRIPKPLIEQCGLGDDIELDVRDGALVIHSTRRARAGWDKAFAQMARLQDDALVDSAPIVTKWDDEDWQWK